MEINIDDFRYYDDCGGFYTIRIKNKFYSANCPKGLVDKLVENGFTVKV